MRWRTLLLLSFAAVALLLTALWFSAQRRPLGGDTLGESIAPGLEQAIPGLTRFAVIGAGAKPLVEATREEAGWHVTQREGWPADVGQLRGWLLSLAQARRLEAKTARPENYPQLGVEDVNTPEAKGVRVEIEAPEDYRIALIVGQNNPHGRGHYVRLADQTQSWLVDADLAVEKDPARWLARGLIDVPASRIVVAEIRGPGRKPVTVTHDSEAEGRPLRLDRLPRGRHANDTALEAAAGFLEGLRLDDVRRAAPPAAEPELKAEFVRQDGLLVEIALWPDEAAAKDTTVMPWAAIAVTLDEERAEDYLAGEVEKDRRAWEAAKQPPVGAEADKGEAGKGAAGEAEGGEQPLPAQAAAEATTPPPEPPGLDARLARLREEVANLQAKTQGWLFKLPAYKLANLRRPPDEFLAPAK